MKGCLVTAESESAPGVPLPGPATAGYNSTGSLTKLEL